MNEYFVRFRYVNLDMMFTPLIYISIDHIRLTAKKSASHYDIQLAVANELSNLNFECYPEHIRLEDYQEIK